jgi:citrate lyase beta subunit
MAGHRNADDGFNPMNAREHYRHIRSILEVSLLNEKHWSKIPTVPADAVMLDLEDSAGPSEKGAARQRLMSLLKDPNLFGAREVIVRVNNLATPWGRDDLESLRQHQGNCIVCYPKVEEASEIAEVLRAAGGSASGRGIYVMLETAKAIANMDSILRCEGVVGAHFGYTDYAPDVGCRLFNATEDDLSLALLYPRTKIAVTTAAYGLISTGGSYLPAYKDLEKVQAFVRSWVEFGYTGCIALAPSHLPIINSAFTPSETELDEARQICLVYEAALAKGQSSAMRNGKLITLPTVRTAKLLLARGEQLRPSF